MKYLIFLTFIMVNCYEISLSEVQDCVAKNCDNENQNCTKDSTCNQALTDFNACFSANQHNATYPYEECKGVSNTVYSTLMTCYENCDYDLILAESILVMTIYIFFMVN